MIVSRVSSVCIGCAKRCFSEVPGDLLSVFADIRVYSFVYEMSIQSKDVSHFSADVPVAKRKSHPFPAATCSTA